MKSKTARFAEEGAADKVYARWREIYDRVERDFKEGLHCVTAWWWGKEPIKKRKERGDKPRFRERSF